MQLWIVPTQLTVNDQMPDIWILGICIPDTFKNLTYLCKVFQWLKQDGDHSKTRPKIDWTQPNYSDSLDHFYKNILFYE